jgi:hypothetical protein
VFVFKEKEGKIEASIVSLRPMLLRLNPDWSWERLCPDKG